MKRSALILLVAVILTGYGLPGAKTLIDVKIPMRDGVRLSANIYLPEGEGPFPVIFVRIPYDNGKWDDFDWPGTRSYDFTENGYVYLIQDVRGTYDSEGEFYPWHQEIKDGYDTRKWIAQQSWCNGKIGIVGPSYMGWVQWLGVLESDDYLTTMMPASTTMDGWIWGAHYVNGAYQLALNHTWGFLAGGRTMQPTAHHHWEKLLKFLPLIEMDKEGTGREIRFLRDWIEHPTYDDYWREVSAENQFHKINLPVYNLAGWFDAYPASAFRAFNGMRKQAPSEKIRKSQKILVGPWPHNLSRSSRVGDVDFGPDAVLDLQEVTLRWCDYWMKGIDNGIMDEPPIQIFVMGDNVWRGEHEWPLARTQFTRFYLHSGGRANTLHGDGTLNREAHTGEEVPDRYTYDPENPVPTRGGSLSFTIPGVGRANELAGPHDQRPNERRDDVLVFTSEPLREDMEVTGPVSCKLYVSSSAPDTDFVVRLVDVHPAGKALGFSEALFRMRYRDSRESPTLMEAGTIYPVTIEMFPTSLVFKKGHRIRVDITSSNFPHFARNLNTGHEFGKDTEIRIADQTIHHSAQYPSHILLPVIP